MSGSTKKRLEWSARSADHLLQIEEYIAAEKPLAAQKVVQKILLTVEQLPGFPMIGHTGRRPGTREIIVPRYPYFIVYRLTATRISILAVMHQARQYP
jgi:toxin ParE1/3/4